MNECKPLPPLVTVVGVYPRVTGYGLAGNARPVIYIYTQFEPPFLESNDIL